MRVASNGYTIVEVLIVLAVSTAIFLAVTVVFGGKNTQTQFDQSMQDLASKIQNYADQILTGSQPDTGDKYCTISSSKPIFVAGGVNPEPGRCIFLGRALMVNLNQTSISAYAVFGTRNRWANNIDSGDQAVSFEQTNPQPAQLQPPGGGDLFVDTYSLGGAKIVSSTLTGQTGNYNLIGIYIDLAGNGAGNSSRASGLITKAYPFTGGSGSDVKTCIEGTFDNCGSPVNNFGQWNLCISDGSRLALLSVKPQAGGLNTQIFDKACT